MIIKHRPSYHVALLITNMSLGHPRGLYVDHVEEVLKPARQVLDRWRSQARLDQFGERWWWDVMGAKHDQHVHVREHPAMPDLVCFGDVVNQVFVDTLCSLKCMATDWNLLGTKWTNLHCIGRRVWTFWDHQIDACRSLDSFRNLGMAQLDSDGFRWAPGLASLVAVASPGVHLAEVRRCFCWFGFWSS